MRARGPRRSHRSSVQRPGRARGGLRAARPARGVRGPRQGQQRAGDTVARSGHPAQARRLPQPRARGAATSRSPAARGRPTASRRCQLPHRVRHDERLDRPGPRRPVRPRRPRSPHAATARSTRRRPTAASGSRTTRRRPGRSVGEGLPTQVVAGDRLDSPGGGRCSCSPATTRSAATATPASASTTPTTVAAAGSTQRRARRPARLRGRGRPDRSEPRLRRDGRRAVPLDRRRRELQQRQPPDGRGAVDAGLQRQAAVRTRTASSPTWSPTSSSRARRTPVRGRATGGAVMAAVGWRAGHQAQRRRLRSSRPATASTCRTPARRGRSPTPTSPATRAHAAVGTDPLTQARIGRVELGIATGAKQNHQHRLRARAGRGEVQRRRRRGSTSTRRSDQRGPERLPQRRSGSRTDFGGTWRQLEGSTAIDTDTTSSSALAPPACKAPAVISLLPGHPGLVQPIRRAGPDAADRRRRPDPAGLRARGGLGEPRRVSQPTGLDGTTPTQFQRRRPLLRRRGVHAARRSTARCRSARPRRTGRCRRDHDAPRPARGAVRAGRRRRGVDALRRQRRRRLQAAPRHRRRASNTTGARASSGQAAPTSGCTTLQPYDAAMAKDGTVYMGLQDNGEAQDRARTGRCTRSTAATAFFTAVDPDDSTIAYEEYVGGAAQVDQRRRQDVDDIDAAPDRAACSRRRSRWTDNDAEHLVIGGRDVVETTDGRTRVGDVDGLRPRHAAASRRRRGGRGGRRPGQPAVGDRRPRRSAGRDRGDRAGDDRGLRVQRRPVRCRTRAPASAWSLRARHLRRPPVHDRRRRRRRPAEDQGRLGRPGGAQDWDAYLFRKDGG